MTSPEHIDLPSDLSFSEKKEAVIYTICTIFSNF